MLSQQLTNIDVLLILSSIIMSILLFAPYDLSALLIILAQVPVSSPLLQPNLSTLLIALALYKDYIFQKHYYILFRNPLLKSGNMMSTNNAETIQIQDQLFVNQMSTCTKMHSIKYEITLKAYSIDLLQQKIKIENMFAKSCKQINKLIK